MLSSARALLRFRRFVARLVDRACWHWWGVLLWLQQRPYLRRLVLPYPSTETVEDYAKQPGSDPKPRRGHPKVVVTKAVLLDLVELRNRMGFALRSRAAWNACGKLQQCFTWWHRRAGGSLRQCPTKLQA